MPSTTEVWIRVVGMLILFLGIYYPGCAQRNARIFPIDGLSAPHRYSLLYRFLFY